MNRYILAASNGLCIAVGIRVCQEHALGVVRGVTYFDDGRACPAVLDEYDRIKRPGSNLIGATEPGPRSSFAEPVSRHARPVVTLLRLLGVTYFQSSGVDGHAQSAQTQGKLTEPLHPWGCQHLHGSRYQARPALTLLRLLGFMRMRGTAELRP